jgi:hypothetical protein
MFRMPNADCPFNIPNAIPNRSIQKPINQPAHFVFTNRAFAGIMHVNRIYTGATRGIAVRRVRVELLARRNARMRLKATAACVR